MPKDETPEGSTGKNSRAATPVLPPITPEPGEKNDEGASESPEAQDEYLNPNFRSGYTLRADRVIEKLNAIGIEAGALPLPGVTDPDTCTREAERRQARKELVRRRQLLERYERNREQMISIRKELGCPEDADQDEDEASDAMYSEDVVNGLRATVRTLRKELRAAERERVELTKRIDNLERLRSESDSERRNADGRVANMKKLVAQAEKRAVVFEQKERSFKQELSKNKMEDRESALGIKLQENEQKVLKQEAQIIAAGRRESILKTKVKALRHELSEERARMSRLLESPDRRKIQEKIDRMRRDDEAAAKIQAQARGAQARKTADIAMRAATEIQAVYRRKKAARELQLKTKQNVIEARKCMQRLGEVRKELGDVERRRDLAAMDYESLESKVSSAKQELGDVTKQLQETRLALTGALTLKGRSAAQGLLSRWKEVEAINAALAEAKLEEQALVEARIARQAEAEISSIVESDSVQQSAGGEAEANGQEDEEYDDEEFE